ncbi:aminotransferase class III-fold pyridoxal phosphate-dependent enzyme [Candidatus Eisenbacteria bacterium]|uniref:Aminotransferase class III-fold pyridoxal phosphate-dependent enzyme n=1 Tax=Eiseniibacteriota bacterium TaxID=2212470 RepID=A0ABV6YMG5_UNCEI
MKQDEDRLLWYPGNELLLRDIVTAENCHLYDASGRRYVDLEAGVWCTPIGHANPRVLAVIAEQSARIAHTGFSYSSQVVEDAAGEILSLLDFSRGKCVFLCSGSEAVEYGVRVAQSITNRPLLMTMVDSYCGAYGSANRKQEDEWYCFDWSTCDRCPDSKECNQDCALWAAIPYDRIGGFLLEPGSSSGLVRFPPGKLIRKIVDTVKQRGGLLLVNEVTTGIGRTGTWFGYQHYRISPDVVALGKGIGNGYPVSVAAFGSEVTERLDDKSIKYAQSHQNDPLGAAVVMEVIRVIRSEHLIERGKNIAALLATGLREISERTSRIRAIRARGLMFAIELEDDVASTTQVHDALFRQGFLLGRRPGVSVLRVDPALTIEREDIRGFLQSFAEVLT